MASVYELTTFAAAIPLFLLARVLHSYIVEIQKAFNKLGLIGLGKRSIRCKSEQKGLLQLKLGT